MIRAKKQYGQNSLHDKKISTKITQAIPKDVKEVAEIGPGLGDLTREPLKISPVRAYEIDADLIGFLRDKFQKELKEEKFILFHQGASGLFCFDEDKYFLVANLPYYIASKLILQTLEDENCQGLIVMVQKEMALKFCAKSGSSDSGTLGVLSTMICEREIFFDISPSCFNPPPKVVSSVMKLIEQKELKQICELDSLENFLRIYLKSPRKQLLSDLKAEKRELLEFFEDLGLKENVHPHELCVNSYLKTYEKLKDQYERK